MPDLSAPPDTLLERDAIHRPLGDDLFELTLSRANKAELFKEAISKLSQSSHEASRILSNLDKWNPSDASRFILRSSSTILDTPFRLIFPNSALPSFDNTTGLYVRQYLAISYCWRSDEFAPPGYKRHGDWPTSKPFVDAILSDKNHPRVGIWMDQLCIDQSSPDDKAKSVSAMDIIYRSCIRLVVLLEDVFLSKEEAALPFKYGPTNPAFEKTRLPEENDVGLFISVYTKVNKARWWTRAWCLHEFVVNDPWTAKRQDEYIHNATFIVNGPNGSTVKIKWADLHRVMVDALFILHNLHSPEKNVLKSFNGQYIFSGVERSKDETSGSKSSLMARYHGVMRNGCLYLADRLSVMINMRGLALAYVGDTLETRDEVLYFSTLLALALGERYPLVTFGNPPVLLDNRPTWLARSVGEDDTSIPNFDVGGVQGIHHISTHEIDLDMVFFHSNWQLIKDEDLECTYTIFRDIIPITQPVKTDGLQETIHSTYSDIDRDKGQRRFLAGCILNGYSFTLRLWQQLQRVVIPDYNKGGYKDLEPNPSLRVAAKEFMAQFPVAGFSDAVLRTFTVEDAQVFLTWFTDPRSMYYISTHTFRPPYALEGHQALVTALHVKEDFWIGAMEELRVAMPTDVLAETCMALKIWLLRPTKEEKSKIQWRLVGKALLLGEPGFVMNEGEIAHGKNGVMVIAKERTIVGG
jgi:hypothetical protein